MQQPADDFRHADAQLACLAVVGIVLVGREPDVHGDGRMDGINAGPATTFTLWLAHAKLKGWEF
jgi:hypothetical protein